MFCRANKKNVSLGCFFLYLHMNCEDMLRWWGWSGKLKFPYLPPVAQQVLVLVLVLVLRNQAAAAQVEPDFSGCGNLLKLNRSRIDTYWVEMTMSLKVNYAHIPEHEYICTCLLERFTGKDTDLVAAEAAFDVSTNTAAPTAGDMSVDED